MSEPTVRDRFRGCLLGLAASDALGTTLEFKSPGSFEPIDDMVGGGPFDLQPGQWTDDTSMALCLATSLLECDGFDPEDQMQRYLRWVGQGYLSSTGTCFDFGRTVARTLAKFIRYHNPYSGSTDPDTAGNGSLMRLAPVPMYFAAGAAEATAKAADSSCTTHAAHEAVDASIAGEYVAADLLHHPCRPRSGRRLPLLRRAARGHPTGRRQGHAPVPPLLPHRGVLGARPADARDRPRRRRLVQVPRSVRPGPGVETAGLGAIDLRGRGS